MHLLHHVSAGAEGRLILKCTLIYPRLTADLHSAAQNVFELLMLLPLPSKYRNYRCVPPYPVLLWMEPRASRMLG